MKIDRETVVALCQDYGYSTADGWNDAKLERKLGEIVQLCRGGEWKPQDDLADAVKRMVSAARNEEEFEIVDSDDDADEPREEIEASSLTPEKCPLEVGDRVLVDEDGEEWKGIVAEIIDETRVEVRDRERKTWHVPVSCCKLVKRGRDVEKAKAETEAVVEKEGKSSHSSEDEELRELQERLKSLKARRKVARKPTRKKKKLSRDELALKTVKLNPEGETFDRLADQVNVRWIKQGGKQDIQAATAALKRVLKYGRLFGLVIDEDNLVRWNEKD